MQLENCTSLDSNRRVTPCLSFFFDQSLLFTGAVDKAHKVSTVQDLVYNMNIFNNEYIQNELSIYKMN